MSSSRPAHSAAHGAGTSAGHGADHGAPQSGQPRVSYRLVRAEQSTERVPLDAHQQAVVDHAAGPLLVLAGPGTGKTTTLVESIVDRVENRGVDPDSVLALTFSRKAAEQLREKVTARLGRTISSGLAATFHSFAYSVVRRFSPAELYAAPLRLLSAPEQDVVLRELLTKHAESVVWPESLERALNTRGFAREVNAVLSRAREKGLDGPDLQRLGEEEGLPEFIAAGRFLEAYLNNLDFHGATDYSDLIRRAVIEAGVHRDELRARFSHVFVDEYQDTDPGQVALLQELAGDGRNLTVVGDPHQSIYGFRGAEVRGILDFPTSFPKPDGSPADVIALGRTRRFGPHLLLAAQRVARRLPLPGALSEEVRHDFTDPVAEAAGVGPGKVVVRTFDTERAEAEHLADLLRRAHLEDGLDWSEMAVLVRSGRSTIPGLRRALTAAGVPVEVSSDEVPLARDPAVLPLLDAMVAVVNLDNDDPDHVDYLHPSRVEGLLMGPLGGLDVGDVRRLARRLRVREREAARAEQRTPAVSGELLRRALTEPGYLDDLDLPEPPEESEQPESPGAAESAGRGESAPEVDRARALHDLLHRARAELDADASAEEVLWTLWAGTDWPDRLRRMVENGGGGARRAHRDLDSVCALFESVARAEEQRLHLKVPDLLATLAAQQIPADTLAERGVRGSTVRLLTAHRSKGLQWKLVVVAHVQAEQWPDLRRRASLLQPDRIGTHGLVGPLTPRELLAEERRLFYVACTRARERLVVTAVRSPDDEGEQPSRFLEELGMSSIEHIVGRPQRPLSMAGLVSDLRRTLTDPQTPEPLRQAAAARLARLAEERVGHRQLVPAADPGTWWGTRAGSRSQQPLRPVDRPVPISASALESMMICPAQWFLTQEAGGVSRAHQSANIGQLVHALAQRVATGEIEAGRDDVEVLMAHVDEVWDRFEFRTPWSKRREYARIRGALAKFLAWHHDGRRRLIGVEQRFEAVVANPDGSEVKLIGYADRLEIDDDGAVVVVDLKTGRTAPTGPAVKSHRQLGLYQYAIDSGAADGLLPDPGAGAAGRSGGAELIQLGLEDDSARAKVQEQEVQAADGAAREQLRAELQAAATMLRSESFPAVAGSHCEHCAFQSICPIKGAGSVTG